MNTTSQLLEIYLSIKIRITMRLQLFASIALALLLTFSSDVCYAQSNPSKKPVKVIYDTDIDLDVDDVGALAVLHAFADKGEAEILGVICNAPTPYGATTISAINKYYGRSNIPIGDMPELQIVSRVGCKRVHFKLSLFWGTNISSPIRLRL